MKRRASNDEDDDVKKSRTEDEEHGALPPKFGFNFHESPFIERLRLAKHLFNNTNLVENDKKEEKGAIEKVKQEPEFRPVSLKSPTPCSKVPPPHSQPQISHHSQHPHHKPSIINTNSKQLEKVREGFKKI